MMTVQARLCAHSVHSNSRTGQGLLLLYNITAFYFFTTNKEDVSSELNFVQTHLDGKIINHSIQ